MPLEIVIVPCCADNYAYLLHDIQNGETALIDAPDAAPILAALKERHWSLGHILLTHHHGDHIAGVEALRAATGAHVYGAASDAERLPPLDVDVRDNDIVSIGTTRAQALEVAGHTIGHIAWYFPTEAAVFTGDSLMALGCGRLFEGTPQQMWHSLSKLAALPPETLVYSGHEYSQSNARFALTIEPENAALQARVKDIDAKRAKGLPTVPVPLALECATNPFLRAANPAIKTRLGVENTADDAVFAKIRHLKDAF